MNFKYLIWGTNLKEENFIRNLSIKSKLQIINMLLILHKLMLGSLFVINSGHALIFFFPVFVMIVNILYNIVHNYNSYKRIRNFYNKLEDLYNYIILYIDFLNFLWIKKKNVSFVLKI